jgi:transcriptional regulator with XRE-family HTH domain
VGFGENLRAARERLGLTQQQVAQALGVSKSTYCGYETGKRQPDVKKLQQISNILEVEADTLLETRHARPLARQVQAALWGGDRSLSQEDLDILWEDVRAYAAFKAQQRKKDKG